MSILKIFARLVILIM